MTKFLSRELSDSMGENRKIMDEDIIKILVVDDDEDDFVLVRDLILEAAQNHFTVDWVSTYEEGLQEIEACRHHVYLLDYRLGAGNGLELLKEARALACKSPLILLTGQGDRDVDMAAMAAGAADFLDKTELRGTLLERSIRYALDRKQAEEALKAMQQEVIRIDKFESLSILAGGIAHDYNNLLAAVLGYTDLVLMDMEPGTPGHENKSHEDLTNAYNAALQMKDLTRRFLEISKGSIPSFRSGSLEPLIKDCVTRCAEGFNGRFALHVPDDLMPALFDYRQMARVFTNVCTNGYESMPEGSFLEIAARNVALETENAMFHLAPGPYVEVTIEDKGSCISEENLPRIMDPYFTTKRMGIQKGMGLGLTTAYAIVKNHKGSLTVTSREGEGTTVTIFLPAEPQPATSNE